VDFVLGSRTRHWRVLNKIDQLKQQDIRSELKLQFNNQLIDRDNNRLTNRSESGLQINSRLRDMINGALTKSEGLGSYNSEYTFIISAVEGAGFDVLLTALEQRAQSSLAGAEQALVTRARHRLALTETVAALDRASSHSLAGQEDLIAEELRSAATALGRLTGRVDVDDVLDVVFRDFCIGK
jgi:tRNA U34 5-carboxymethylaminomethyl modifying GTPase MnmE/TrmE